MIANIFVKVEDGLQMKQTKSTLIYDKLNDPFVYEVMDNKPLHYKGYKSSNKQIEDIMGSSALQALIVSVILRFLFKNLPEDKYEIITNEAGLHLDNHDNLAADIGIYNKNILSSKEITDKYLEVPPKIVIEVDTKADTQNFEDSLDYYHRKTKKLLDFGVEKVIWITTKSQRVMVATPHTDWKTLGWDKNIEILEGIQFSLTELLKQRSIKFC